MSGDMFNSFKKCYEITKKEYFHIKINHAITNKIFSRIVHYNKIIQIFIIGYSNV